MVEIRPVTFDFNCGNDSIVIAGPCSAESRGQVLATAEALSKIGVHIFRAGVWKPRTKPGCFEGVGEAALEWLQEVKKETGMLVACEVASADHVRASLDAGIDILWIGARSTANPFVVQEIADELTGSSVPVFVKNPVNPDIDLWIGAIERLQNAGVRKIGAIHRGFSSYDNLVYRNEPIWQIPIELRRRFPDMTILCDPSHLGGKREFVAEIAQKAFDLNFDGLMIETHCYPDCALSDAQQQITPFELDLLLRSLVRRENMSVSETLSSLRREIDEVDEKLLQLLARRMELSKEIGTHKKLSNMPVLQSDRYAEVLRHRSELGESLGLSSEFVDTIMKEIHQESVKSQLDSCSEATCKSLVL